jgi:hypothetical protein
VEECVEAWWRVTDSPPGRLLPAEPSGIPGDVSRLCSAFDLYCWRLVCEAFENCKSRNVPATKLCRLLEHRMKGQPLEAFRVFEPITIDADDPDGWRSKPRPVSEIERLGLEEEDLARSALAKFRRTLQQVIDASPGFVPPARGDAA